jgi:predicted GNAT superfamily acetyltransferase
VPAQTRNMTAPLSSRLQAASADAADPVTDEALEVARRHARSAAAAAGVRIEPVAEPRRLRAVADLFAQVWSTSPGHDPLASDVLRAIAHAGGAVHVAYKGSRAVGAAVAIFGPPRSGMVYSLIAATRRSDRGVGLAVKQHQRAWALGHGAHSMVWTFDPLVGRNARFNLVKLGAVAPTYLVDFYGPLDDGVNAGDETDRLTVVWSLTGGRANDAAEGRYPEAEGPDLDIAAADSRLAPDGGLLVARDADSVWCRVPADIVTVRGAHPQIAAQWRTAVRDIFLSAIEEGFVATVMTRDGWYHLTRKEAS